MTNTTNTTMTKRYRLTIFSDPRTEHRETFHVTRAQAQRSLYDFERRTGERWISCIDRLPLPDQNDARGWDEYRTREGCPSY